MGSIHKTAVVPSGVTENCDLFQSGLKPEYGAEMAVLNWSMISSWQRTGVNFPCWLSPICHPPLLTLHIMFCWIICRSWQPRPKSLLWLHSSCFQEGLSGWCWTRAFALKAIECRCCISTLCHLRCLTFMWKMHRDKARWFRLGYITMHSTPVLFLLFWQTGPSDAVALYFQCAQ